MLRRLTAKQLLEWKQYDDIEPIGDLRRDWHAASICCVLANLAVVKSGGRKRFKVKDFLLEWGEERDVKGRRQTWQEQKMIAQMIALAFTDPPRK